MAFDWRSNALSCSEARQKTTQRTATANFRGFRNAHLGVESRWEWDFSMEVSSKFPHEEAAEAQSQKKGRTKCPAPNLSIFNFFTAVLQELQSSQIVHRTTAALF